MKKKITIAFLIISLAVQAQVFTPVQFDKKYHIGAGVVMATWGTFAGNSLGFSNEESALFGAGVGFASGLGKEIWDVSFRIIDKRSQFDINDIAATTLGSIIGAGLTYVGLRIFKNPPEIYAIIDDRSMKVGVKIKLICHE